MFAKSDTNVLFVLALAICQSEIVKTNWSVKRPRVVVHHGCFPDEIAALIIYPIGL